jgi:hypothetical protein
MISGLNKFGAKDMLGSVIGWCGYLVGVAI